MQSSWAVGYALGAAVVAVVMPRFGWRAVFFVGVAPALVTCGCSGLKEPEVWRQGRASRQAGPLFRGAFGQRAGVRDDECGDAVCVVGIVYVGAAISFLAGGRGWARAEHCADLGWTIVMEAGTFLGYIGSVSWPTASAVNIPTSAICSWRQCWCRCLPSCAIRTRC